MRAKTRTRTLFQENIVTSVGWASSLLGDQPRSRRFHALLLILLGRKSSMGGRAKAVCCGALAATDRRAHGFCLARRVRLTTCPLAMSCQKDWRRCVQCMARSPMDEQSTRMWGMSREERDFSSMLTSATWHNSHTDLGAASEAKVQRWSTGRRCRSRKL